MSDQDTATKPPTTMEKVTAGIGKFKALWALLGGGAVAGLIGTGIFYIYLWGVGGVPMGQLSQVGVFSKVILPATLFIFVVLFFFWVAPSVVLLGVLGSAKVDPAFVRLFTSPTKPLAPASANAQVATPDDGSDLRDRVVNRQSVVVFAAATAGLACMWPLLLFMTPASIWLVDKSNVGLVWGISTLVLLVGLSITIQWLLWQRSSAHAAGSASANPAPTTLYVATAPAPAPAQQTPNASFFSVALAGIGVSIVSLLPLLMLVVIIIESESFVRESSVPTFILSMVAIALGVTAAFAFSVGVLLNRRNGERVQWLHVVAGNAVLLVGFLIASRISGQMLDSVMVLSSVRVEHATLFLEPDGCEILSAMSMVGDGVGWSPAPNKDSKTCMLYNVTIQSTLDPAMQIACWRRHMPKTTKAQKDQPAVENAASAPPLPATPSALPAVPASAAASAAGASSIRPDLLRNKAFNADAVIDRGSFSMPTKYVRNLWKLSRAPAEMTSPVCPQDFSIQRIESQVIPAAQAAAFAAASATTASATTASATTASATTASATTASAPSAKASDAREGGSLLDWLVKAYFDALGVARIAWSSWRSQAALSATGAAAQRTR